MHSTYIVKQAPDHSQHFSRETTETEVAIGSYDDLSCRTPYPKACSPTAERTIQAQVLLPQWDVSDPSALLRILSAVAALPTAAQMHANVSSAFIAAHQQCLTASLHQIHALPANYTAAGS